MVASMSRSTRRSPAPVIELPEVVPMSNRRGTPASLEVVGRDLGDEHFDAVLYRIAESALSLTGATGAALAFQTGGKMICRARAGHPAPPLGAPVDATQGLSGECVRNRLLVSCEDTENDPRIDPEVARVLGLRSLMAAPIVSNAGPADKTVVGLLEIFSPHPHAFTSDHATILNSLVSMIPQPAGEPADPGAAPAETQPEIPETAPQPLGVESGSIKSASPALVPIETTREDSPDQKPEVLDQVSPQAASENAAAAQALDNIPEPEADPAPAPRHDLLHWLLLHWIQLAPVVAGASLALGYLFGSLIQRR